MKDAKGHGSNPRGAHAEGVEKVGLPLKMMRVSALHPTKDVFLEDNPNRDPTKVAETNQQHQAEIDSMRATLRTGGQLPPLIATPKGNLLDGHHRLLAYKAEGIKRVPVEIQGGYNESELERIRKERGL